MTTNTSLRHHDHLKNKRSSSHTHRAATALLSTPTSLLNIGSITRLSPEEHARFPHRFGEYLEALRNIMALSHPLQLSGGEWGGGANDWSHAKLPRTTYATGPHLIQPLVMDRLSFNEPTPPSPLFTKISSLVLLIINIALVFAAYSIRLDEFRRPIQ